MLPDWWKHKWLNKPVVESYIHAFVLLLTDFFTLMVRFQKVSLSETFLGRNAISSLSVPGYEFWALASQPPWCWLLVASPLDILLGHPSTWLDQAPYPQATIPTSLGILRPGCPPLDWNILILWYWYTSSSGADFFNDESTGSIYLSIILFQRCAFLPNPSDAIWKSVCYQIPSLEVSSVSMLSGAQKVLNRICWMNKSKWVAPTLGPACDAILLMWGANSETVHSYKWPTKAQTLWRGHLGSNSSSTTYHLCVLEHTGHFNPYALGKMRIITSHPPLLEDQVTYHM